MAAELFNPYHVIVVKHAGTNVGCAREFARWIDLGRHPAGRSAASGSKQYGQPLFFPDARP